MYKYIIFPIIFTFFASSLTAQTGKAYQFYNKNGKAVKYNKVVRSLSNYDVIFIGELHDNSINHWLQLQIVKSLYERKNRSIILGAEMFERDNQKQLNDYLAGEIGDKELKDSARLWINFKTDYQPLVDFAKEYNLEFIATNIPRRYASFVARTGLDTLNHINQQERKYMMKLPIEVTLDTPGYSEMIDLLGEHAGPNPMNFVAAQAVKDATMAESIFRNLKKGQLFIHFNGDYHSKEYGGIVWYLRKLNPKLKIAVISVRETDDPKLSLLKDGFIRTDFMLVIPEDMTKTY